MSILQGTIPDDWEGEYCCYSVEWPNSPQWLAVLRGVLTMPARGRFWDEHTGNIIEAQGIIRETFNINLHLQEVLMSCNDPNLANIASALTQIAQALAAQGSTCCDNSGSGGSGQTQPPFTETPENDPNVDPPPEGFETWQEFYAQKCAVAFNIVERLQIDLGNMAIINFASISLSSLATLMTIVIATPVPFDDVIAIAGLLLTVVAEIVITTALDIVNTNEEDLVCELYIGTDSQSSRSMFMSQFGDLVDTGVTDPVENFIIKALVGYMIGSIVTNRLYQKDLTTIWPLRDCSGCISGGLYLDRWEIEGNVIAELFVPADWFGMISKNDNTVHDLFLSVSSHIVRCEFRSLSGWTSVTNSFQIGQNVLGDILVTDDFDEFRIACETINLVAPSTSPVFQWAIYSSTQFTLEAKMSLIG